MQARVTEKKMGKEVVKKKKKKLWGELHFRAYYLKGNLAVTLYSSFNFLVLLESLFTLFPTIRKTVIPPFQPQLTHFLETAMIRLNLSKHIPCFQI